MFLAVHTGVSPDYWMHADQIVINTALQIMADKNKD